ncbi:MAG: hypothetical protein H0T66_11745 [Geodermatophilaceae bacterium]|nr:hypothetical protein [Geodermatophilaceae bacterium]
MTFDHRLREGLHRTAAASPPADVERSLSRVVIGRRRRVWTRRGTLGLVAAALVTGMAVGVPAVVDELRKPPESGVLAPGVRPGLPGVYVVDIGDSALAAQHAMSGRWEIELRLDGTALFDPPDAFRSPTSGISYRVEGNEVRVDAFNSDPLCFVSQVSPPVGIYRWTRTSEALRFVPVSETCAARELLFAGQTWVVQP